LTITPQPAGSSLCLDQDGNVICEIHFNDPVEQLHVESTFEVETMRDNPFDYLLRGPGMFTLPTWYPETVELALAPYLRPSGAVQAFASDLARGTTPLEFLSTLNNCIHEQFRYQARDTGPARSPEETLRQASGSCRDLAVLFSESARSLGIAARFVSGYEVSDTEAQHINMHAWSEVYLEGGGWRGYDPSSGLAVASNHIAVAAAADPRLAAPITGTYRGAANSSMHFQIARR
jgi:transglutaminase-like putative cysteine protease